MVAGAAAQKLAMTLAKEQEILMNIADIANEAYMAESVLLRTEKRVKLLGEADSAVQIEMMKAYIWDASNKINDAGRDALVSFAEGDELKMMLMGIKRYTKIDPFNIKESRRVVAQAVIDANKYCF